MAHGPRRETNPRLDIMLPQESISFDVAAFDNLIRSHGVVCEVYSAMLCPIDTDDANDMRSHMHPQCQNGFLYRKEGDVTISFLGNNTRPNFTESGMQDNSNVTASIPRFYDCPAEKPVVLGQYYRVYIKDCPVVVTNSEKIEHHQSGIDRLAYPILKVLRLVDSRGHEYAEGEDFEVTAQGHLQWNEGRSPGYNTVLNKGIIFAIEYQYRPFYYVASMPHEIRVSKDIDPMTGVVSLVRMPYQVQLQREWTFDQSANEPDKPRNERSATVPRQGSFGPR